MEEASEVSGQKYISAVNGSEAGGGYELALATDYILLNDDGSSTVSLPELPLLAVLPGTGGLTRLAAQRRVRRHLADVFCTLAVGGTWRRAVRRCLADGLRELVHGRPVGQLVGIVNQMPQCDPRVRLAAARG